MSIRVKATQLGYYKHVRRRPGVLFALTPVKGKKRVDGKLVDVVLTPEQQFSPSWMERLDADESEEALEEEEEVVVEAPKAKSGKGKAAGKASNSDVI